MLLLATPTLEARFVLDSTGAPIFVMPGARRHYAIDLRLRDVPEDAYVATYKLESSYPDPFQTSRDRSDGFVLHIHSYGDYTIRVEVLARDGRTSTAASLADALAATHGSDPNPAVQKALDDIRRG